MRTTFSSFLDELEKIAISKTAISRAAKELLKGSLSSRTLSTIRAGLRRPEAMASGLARGSANIAKKLDIPIYEGSFRKAMKEIPGALKNLRAGEKIPEKALRTMGTPFAALGGGGGLTIPGGDMRGIYLHPSQTFLRGVVAKQSGGRLGALKELAGKGMNPSERNHLAELIKRHEVDEARAMARSSSYMRRTGTPWTPGWKDFPFTKGNIQTGGGMHADPRVLLEESRNLTFAPKKVREVMQTVRGMTGEQSGMRNLAGVDIGRRTPPAGSRSARVAERQLKNVPKPTLMTGSGPVYVSPEYLQKGDNLLERGRAAAEKVKGLVDRAKSKLGR